MRFWLGRAGVAVIVRLFRFSFSRRVISKQVEIASCRSEAISDGVNGRGREKVARFALCEGVKPTLKFLI